MRKDHTRVNDNKNVTARPRTRRDRPRTSTSRQRCLKYNVYRDCRKIFSRCRVYWSKCRIFWFTFSNRHGQLSPAPFAAPGPIGGNRGTAAGSARLPSRFVKTPEPCAPRSALRNRPDRTHRETRAQYSPEVPLCTERRGESGTSQEHPPAPRAAASSAATESKRDLLSISTSLCISSLQAGTGSTYTRFSLT